MSFAFYSQILIKLVIIHLRLFVPEIKLTMPRMIYHLYLWYYKPGGALTVESWDFIFRSKFYVKRCLNWWVRVGWDRLEFESMFSPFVYTVVVIRLGKDKYWEGLRKEEGEGRKWKLTVWTRAESQLPRNLTPKRKDWKGNQCLVYTEMYECL
jgi:hypothetical protein